MAMDLSRDLPGHPTLSDGRGAFNPCVDLYGRAMAAVAAGNSFLAASAAAATSGYGCYFRRAPNGGPTVVPAASVDYERKSPSASFSSGDESCGSGSPCGGYDTDRRQRRRGDDHGTAEEELTRAVVTGDQLMMMQERVMTSHQDGGATGSEDENERDRTCSSNGSGGGPKKHKAQKQVRLSINARERRRMHDLNDALDELRAVIPYAHGPSVRKLSKIATLLLAKNYILMQARALDELRRLVGYINHTAAAVNGPGIVLPPHCRPGALPTGAPAGTVPIQLTADPFSQSSGAGVDQGIPVVATSGPGANNDSVGLGKRGYAGGLCLAQQQQQQQQLDSGIGEVDSPTSPTNLQRRSPSAVNASSISNSEFYSSSKNIRRQ